MIERQKIYDLLKKIPKGRVVTYKQIAKQMNSRAYRAIGKLVGMNPNIPYTPCHRVVKSSGEIGGYAFGVDKKIAILNSEGIEISNGKIVNFAKKIYKF